MRHGYYTIPLSIESLLEKKRHRRCTLQASIEQNVHLILVTHNNEYRYDPDYGCEVWDNDFSFVLQDKSWKNKIERSAQSALVNYEKRLDNIKVRVNLLEVPLVVQGKKLNQKLEIKFVIEAKIRKTATKFWYNDSVYFSPLAAKKK